MGKEFSASPGWVSGHCHEHAQPQPAGVFAANRVPFYPAPKEKLGAVTSTSVLPQPPLQAHHTWVEEALQDKQRALQPPGTQLTL